MGYPNRETLRQWSRELAPDRRKKRKAGLQAEKRSGSSPVYKKRQCAEDCPESRSFPADSLPVEERSARQGGPHPQPIHCELTTAERREIRQLVVGLCTNYDSEYGCLPLDCECYMLNKWWTGSLCRYLESSMLPMNPVLEYWNGRSKEKYQRIQSPAPFAADISRQGGAKSIALKNAGYKASG